MLPPNFFHCVTSQPARPWTHALPVSDAIPEDPAPPPTRHHAGLLGTVSTVVVALIHLRLTHH